MKRQRRLSRNLARVRVPAEQAPVFHVPGPHGGWFASLLYGGTGGDRGAAVALAFAMLEVRAALVLDVAQELGVLGVLGVLAVTTARRRSGRRSPRTATRATTERQEDRGAGCADADGSA